jgi:heat shock protein HslJ
MKPFARLLPLAASILLVAACMTSHDVIADKTWTLVSIDGRPAVAAAGLSFGTDGKLAVRPGCNSGGGPYTIEGNRIMGGPFAITAMGCADDGVMAQETAFMGVVDAGPTFAVDTGTGQLRLTAGGVTLLFDPK